MHTPAHLKNQLANNHFAVQSEAMESNWAVEHLQVIRTLMERSAVYRRAQAPVMIFNGVVGAVAAVAGRGFGIVTAKGFILFWALVAAMALVGSFLLVRRQALKESEPFWSPPTRRVTRAMLPPLTAGSLLAAILLFKIWNGNFLSQSADPMVWLPVAWVVLYGCAFHAAGFFMPRGMRLFGWGFILGGCVLGAVGLPEGIKGADYAHCIMGFFFGLLHLAYGTYLYFTEKRRDET